MKKLLFYSLTFILQSTIINPQSAILFAQCNAWTQKADFGGVIRFGAVGFSIGSKGYLGTGGQWTWAYYKDFWEYDPDNDTWTQKADFGGTARENAVGFSINSKGYIGTGYDSTYRKDFWEYDPVSNIWVQKADFGGAVRDEAAGFSIGGKGYIGTGRNPSYLQDFWEYNPGTNTWIQKGNFVGTARLAAVGFSIGNKGYIGLGIDGAWKQDFWEYDPTNDLWNQKSDFPGSARYNSVGFSIGSKGYVGGGYDGSDIGDFWKYDSNNNNWTQIPDIGDTGIQAPVGFSIGNKGYVGTGVYNGVFQKTFWQYYPDSLSICLITVDSTSTRNVIVWEKPVSNIIDSFRIYRNIVGDYIHIGSVSYNALSEYTDTTVGINPNNTSYKYKISTVDTLGFEGCLSIFHKTIHLQIGLGIPPAINLSWDDYIGFTSWYYRILRDSTGMGNWEAKDSVDSGTLSWTDPNPPQTPNLSYLVEAVLPAGCTATLMKKGKNYNTSKSNKANKQTTGIQDSEVFKTSEVLNAYPNPFTSKTQISYSLTQRAHVLLEVLNILGKKQNGILEME